MPNMQVKIPYLSFFLIPLFLCCLNGASAQELRVTDVLGREVVLKKKVEKVLLGEGRDIVTLNILDQNPVSFVVGWSGDFKRGSEYIDYKSKFPEIDKLPVVGISGETFSTEKAIACNPDVAIFAARGHGP